MIRIVNISKGQANEAHVTARTNWGAGTAAFPLMIDLAPGQQMDIPSRSLSDWDPGVKQWLAEYVVNGLIKVFHINSIHLYQDKGHNAEYSRDYLIAAEFDALALQHAIAMATSFNTEMQLHFNNLAVHGAVAGSITAAVPTDLASLLLWIADAQTEYTTHLASAAAHAVADTWNALAAIVAVDLATSIQALQDMHTKYHSHKQWLNTAGTTEIDVLTLLAY